MPRRNPGCHGHGFAWPCELQRTLATMPTQSRGHGVRHAAPLLEVLVAIFIMGIGLMALLVLFPLGALRMAAAIQNERAAQAGVSASALANMADIRRDPGWVGPFWPTNDFIYYPQAGSNGDAYLNPAPGLTPGPADAEHRSFPLLIDPVGYLTAAGLGSQKSVGNPFGNFLLARKCVGNTNILRPASLSYDVYRWFTFLDDISFDKDGNAKAVQILAPPNPPTMERDIRFSCAFLCQRPRTADVSTVDCTVVVYNSRPLSLTGSLDLPEYPYYRYDNPSQTPEVIFDPVGALLPGPNLIRVYYGIANPTWPQAAPPMRTGDWVLDVSWTTTSGPNGGAAVLEPHGFFYRIAGVTEGVDGQGRAYVDYETQQPLRGFATATTSLAGARLLFLDGVAEVFERGTGKAP